jgi:hypothetical protein
LYLGTFDYTPLMRKTVVVAVGSALIGMLIGTLVISGVKASPEGRSSGPAGVWVATFPDAPFKYHMITFNSDGTMQQANPDAGDIHTSDSDGMGIWARDGDVIKGKFVEITADRTTHAFASRGEISFDITVKGDAFNGNAVGKFYDLDNKVVVGPVQTAFKGTRVTLP